MPAPRRRDREPIDLSAEPALEVFIVIALVACACAALIVAAAWFA